LFGGGLFAEGWGGGKGLLLVLGCSWRGVAVLGSGECGKLNHQAPYPPPQPQEFRQALKAEWGQSAMGRIDMNYLAR